MENRNTQRNTSHWSKARAHNILNPHMASPLGFEHRPNWCPVRDAAATPPWGGARSVVDRGGGGLRISSVRDDRRIFWGRKILASIFLGSLIKVGISLGIQNNLKIRDSSCVSRPHSFSGNSYGSKIWHGIFGGFV